MKKNILIVFCSIFLFSCEKNQSIIDNPTTALNQSYILEDIPILIQSLQIENNMVRFINRKSFETTIGLLDNQNSKSSDDINDLMHQIHDQLTYLDFLDETENFEDVDDYEVDSIYDFGHYTLMTLLNTEGLIWIGDTIYKITKPEIQLISPETGVIYERIYDGIQGPVNGTSGNCGTKRTGTTGFFDNNNRKVRHEKYSNNYVFSQAIGMKTIHYKKNWRGKYKRQKVDYIRVQLYEQNCVKWYYSGYSNSPYSICGWVANEKLTGKRVSKEFGVIILDGQSICWEEYGKTAGHINWGPGPNNLDLNPW